MWDQRRRDADDAQMDDPVDALQESVLWAVTESDASGDATELADKAVPLAPEEAAVVERAKISPDDDELTVGLPAGSDIDGTVPDDLLKAELVAISEGDPEAAAILADELRARQAEA